MELEWTSECREILTGKKPYLHTDQKSHDLLFLKPFSEHDVPVEIILYDRCRTPATASCSVHGEIISAKYYTGAEICCSASSPSTHTQREALLARKTENVSGLIEAMQVLGAKYLDMEDGQMLFQIHGILDKYPRLLSVAKLPHQALEQCYLDQRGYGCPTLLVNRIEPCDYQSIHIGQPESFLVHEKRYSIAFAVIPGLSCFFELMSYEGKL